MADRPIPRVSVVVPCHNRARYLAVLLRSLTWSTLPPSSFEVIVVNDGGSDDVQGVTDCWAAKGLDVRLITIRPNGGPRNNARARNAGLHDARGPVVLQTDPDIVFVSDVLRAAAQIQPGTFLSCDGYYPLTEAATCDVAFGPSGPSDNPAAYLARARGRPDQTQSPDGVGGLHGAFVCARQDLIDIGGYDESFEYWGWEDREVIVTLEDRGIVRRHMPATVVVHLWHPVARGDLRREELAVRGKLSRAAWDVQMQRVAAEYPRARRPRMSRPSGGNPEPEEFGPEAYQNWVPRATRADAIPRTWQMFFDAHRLEANALRSAGHVALARALLRYAIRRPWELDASAGFDWTSHAFALELDPERGFSDPGLSQYDRVERVIEALAGCEEQLGDLAGRDRALEALSQSLDGRAAAAACRLRSALTAGNLEDARSELPSLATAPWTPHRAALAVETQLLDGRPRCAFKVTEALAGSGQTGDLFERMRLVEYLRLIERLDDSLPIWEPWSELASSFAAVDDSEFVYSAAMRSRRDGLDLAACLLFDRFNSGARAVDTRVMASGVAERRLAFERISRMSHGRTLAAAGYEGLFQYSVSKAPVVRSHA